MGPWGGRLLGPPGEGEECEAGADSLGTSGDSEQALGGWEGMWGSASVGRSLGSAASQVEMETGAGGWRALLS